MEVVASTPTTPAITVGAANFGKQNTPQLIEKIGNIALISAGIGTAIVGLPATLATAGLGAITIPAIVLIAGKGCIAIGVFGKLFTKLFGAKQQPDVAMSSTPN